MIFNIQTLLNSYVIKLWNKRLKIALYFIGSIFKIKLHRNKIFIPAPCLSTKFSVTEFLLPDIRHEEYCISEICIMSCNECTEYLIYILTVIRLTLLMFKGPHFFSAHKSKIVKSRLHWTILQIYNQIWFLWEFYIPIISRILIIK